MKTTHRIAAGTVIGAAALLATAASASAHGADLKCDGPVVDLSAHQYSGGTATVTRDGVVVSTNVFESSLHLVWDGPELPRHVYAVTIVADDGYPTFHDAAGPCIVDEPEETVPKNTEPEATVPEEEPPVEETTTTTTLPVVVVDEPTPPVEQLEPQPVGEIGTPDGGVADDTPAPVAAASPAPTTTAVAAARGELPTTGAAETAAELGIGGALVVGGGSLLLLVSRKRAAR